MKFHRMAFVVAAILPLFAAPNLLAAKSGEHGPVAPADSDAVFPGRWDLTPKAADREYPSLLELREENGQMAGRWGNARSQLKVELSNGHLTFVPPKAEENFRRI